MAEINQCDGCRRGLPVRGGNHYDGARPVMGCTADRYAHTTTPVPAPTPGTGGPEGGAEWEALADKADAWMRGERRDVLSRVLVGQLSAALRAAAERGAVVEGALDAIVTVIDTPGHYPAADRVAVVRRFATDALAARPSAGPAGADREWSVVDALEEQEARDRAQAARASDTEGRDDA